MYHFTRALLCTEFGIQDSMQWWTSNIPQRGPGRGVIVNSLLQGCSSQGFLPPLARLKIAPQEIQIKTYHLLKLYFSLKDFLSI
jgi:hypothetical protein